MRSLSTMMTSMFAFKQLRMSPRTSLFRHFSSSVDITNLDLSFGSKIIFDHLNLHLTSSEKLFLVGENGIGKTTLLKIIKGDPYDYFGKRRINGIIGYLPQSFECFPQRTAIEHLINESKIPELIELCKVKQGSDYETWKDEFYAYGGYQFMPSLHKLNLECVNLQRDFSSLSGGEKAKLHLSALSVLQPDILLLDEPTNHLDTKGLQWLESFLKHYPGALITTTHDRQLINNIATRIAELTPATHSLTHFNGNYKAYLMQQEKIHNRLEQELASQTQEIAKLTKKLSHIVQTKPSNSRRDPSNRDKLSFNARGENKQKSQQRIVNQIANKISTLEKNLIDIPQKPTQINMSFFTDKTIHSDIVIEVHNASKQQGDKLLFDSVNFTLKKHEKVILTGTNGSGKSNFLKMLSGNLVLNEGTVTISPSVKIGYLDQEQETLDLSKSAFELISEHTEISRHKALEHLRKFGIQFDHDIYSPLKDLSTGCKRKVQLAQIVVGGANVLLLDEPTNHIDLVSLEKIEEELIKFPGSIFAISHDRYFIEKIATKTMNMDDFKYSIERSYFNN